MSDELLNAVESGDVGSVEKLLEEGADINYADEDGVTPLMIATQANSIDMIKVVIEKGAAIDTKEKKLGVTALMLAAFLGHAEVAKELLSAGANIYETDNNGQVALRHAQVQGHDNVVEVFKNHNP